MYVGRRVWEDVAYSIYILITSISLYTFAILLIPSIRQVVLYTLFTHSSPAFNGTEKPPSWQKEPWQLDLEDEANNGYKNEDFIVWMRAAVFPTFRKLYR